MPFTTKNTASNPATPVRKDIPAGKPKPNPKPIFSDWAMI